MMRKLILLLAAAVTFASPVCGEQPDWQKELDKQLPLMGHRNWIVVADSAYPSQTAPGIKTIYTGEKQLDAVNKVLAAVAKQKHVRGAVFMDAELPHVPEKFAKGIGDYRAGLKEALQGQNVTSLPHEKIIEQLDEAGQTFHVLLLKTDMTLPYTSVFIRLDCGYWSDEAEQELRAAMEAADKAKE
jgi:L-fucose mutarotase/ribose pyranase (RbsD/FucU family)